ncbi:MAG TPA: SIR2 family protein [Planctomycetota bacterium]|nr:SIR2 family protein [Planctomycetota bacterium]
MNPMVKLAASALPGERKYILFAGAGVSKDAGIPTAWDLMLKTAALLYTAEDPAANERVNLEEWFASSPYAGMGYSELMGELYPNHPDQQSFLSSFLGDKPIGEAHKLIAELARRGIIRAIVTTNFDDCLERALEEKGLKAQVISTEDDLRTSEPLIHCKQVRVYKPHGDLGRGALRNTPIDLEQLAPLMEQELIRVLGEHGVIVLGYSGSDKGIQKVFRERRHTLYPLFWVDPKPPHYEIDAILKAKDCAYIECKGASQFIREYFRLLELVERLGPSIARGPSVSDIELAFESGRRPVGPLYSDFLAVILSDLESTRPGFSKFSEYDDAIFEQIKVGLSITARFLEAAMVASRYDNEEALKALYSWFGRAYKLYSLPEGVAGTYRRTDFDGFKFLVYEMFVSLVACLLKYDRWERLAEMLEDDLFIEKRGGETSYISVGLLSEHVPSLDEIRRQRLNQNRTSIMADLLKERFGSTELSLLLSHREFMEADYLLFLRTVCLEKSLEILWGVWCPQSTVYMDFAPSYVVRAESRAFLERLTRAAGFTGTTAFTEKLKERHAVYHRYFSARAFVHSPLSHFDLNRIGTRK